MSAMPPPPPPPPPAAPGHPEHFAHARVRAGFGARLGGYLLDGLIYGLIAGIFVAIGVGLIVAGAKDCIDKIDAADGDTVTCTSSELNSPGMVFAGIVVIALGLMFVLFLYARSLGKTGQTMGRKIVGVRVVDKFTEQPIGFGRALGRTLFAHLISSAFFSLGYLWMLWDAEKQTWHDKVVGSVVVRG
jgi:uncharacterized RDD family membrane protein YckC